MSLVLAATLGVALATPAQAQVLNEIDKIGASDGTPGDGYGSAVSIDGDTVVVGAPDNAGQGAAYVYVRTGNIWTEHQKLTASDGGSDDKFGASVAISGDTIIVGAYWNVHSSLILPGAAYVYTRTAGVWSEQQKLTAGDQADFDWFGRSVDVDGDRAIIGAHNRFSSTGTAYVFVRSAGVWSEEDRLDASDGAASDFYGWAVAISGDTAAVGSRFDDDNGSGSGSAYLYTRSGSSWSEQQKITASDGTVDDDFGVSIALDGDSVLVGAIQAPFGAPCCNGAAYVFLRTAGVWNEQQKLTASDGVISDEFGASVAIDGDLAVIGAWKANGEAGAAYHFERTGAVWSQTSKLLGSDLAASDWFGDSVAASGSTMVVGASSDDDQGLDSGSAYLFDPNGGGISTFCHGTACPCGNDDPTAGCVNTTGSGAVLSAVGSTSVAADDLVFTCTNVPPDNNGLFFVGPNTFNPVLVGDGIACAGGGIRYASTNSGVGGVMILSTPVADSLGVITAGSTFHFTCWFRDVSAGPSPCGTGNNLSHAVSVAYTN